MDVKRRVRAARRDQKRDSKVGLSDEIIFFDDVAGNTRAKVRRSRELVWNLVKVTHLLFKFISWNNGAKFVS